MARYFRVSPAFWSDHPTWGDDVRLVALYLLTSPHRTTEGLFRMPMAYAATDLGWLPERFAEAFRQLIADGFVEYDATASVCLITQALALQAPENPNQASAAVRAVAELPATPLLARLAALADRYSQRFAEALRARFGDVLGQPPSPSPSPSPSPEGRGCAAADGPDAQRAARRQEQRDEQAVFDAWVTATGRTAATTFDDARRRIVRRALKLKGLEAVLEAVRGVARSEHHMKKRQWSELRVVLRDAGQIEHFQELQRASGASRLREADILGAYRSRQADDEEGQ